MPHHQLRSTAAISTAILALALLGCNAAPSQAPAVDNPQPTTASATLDASPSSYDYYILNLSWSPEFCVTHADNPQCAAHPGFVVHGLWPERNDGTYPEHCPDRPGPTSDALWQGVIPTEYLAQHEWQAHGTCTPYSPDAYFGLIRKAYQSIKIPGALTHTTRQTMQPPADIIDSFARINTGLPAGSIVLSCGNNYLTAIEICFDKNLQPRACSGLRTCHANAVKITPQINGQTDGQLDGHNGTGQ
jgi:ribonuclease T2